MKTTVDLPDELARDAKEFASTAGSSLRELIVDGLREELARRRRGVDQRPDFVFPTFGGGGLVDGISIQDAIYLSYGDRGGGLPD